MATTVREDQVKISFDVEGNPFAALSKQIASVQTSVMAAVKGIDTKLMSIGTAAKVAGSDMGSLAEATRSLSASPLAEMDSAVDNMSTSLRTMSVEPINQVDEATTSAAASMMQYTEAVTGSNIGDTFRQHMADIQATKIETQAAKDRMLEFSQSVTNLSGTNAFANLMNHANSMRASVEGAAQAFEELHQKANPTRFPNPALEMIKGINAAKGQVMDFAWSVDSLGNTLEGTSRNFKSLTQLASEMVKKVSSGFQEIPNKIKSSATAAREFASQLKAVTFDKITSGANKIKDSFQKIKGMSLKDVAQGLDTSLGKAATKGAELVVELKNAAKEKLAGLISGLTESGGLMDKLGGKLDKLGPKLKQLGKNALSSLGQGFSSVLRGITTGVGIAGAATVAAGVAVVRFGADVVTQFAALEQNLGGSEAVFGEYAASIQKTGEDAYRNLGVSQSDYLATANQMGALFQGSGITQVKSLELTEKAMQRAADMASVMGIDMSMALESVAGAAKGNFTMMDNLGVAMNATNIEAYALAKGLDFTWNTATQAEKAEMAMAMFFESTEQYAGNFAKESTQTISGSIGLLKAALGSFTAGLGNANADMINLTSNLVDAFQTAVDNIVPVLKNVVSALPSAMGGILESISGLVPMLTSVVAELFGETMNVLVGLLPQLVPVFAQAITYIVSLAPMFMQAGVSFIQNLIQGIVANQSAIAQSVSATITAFLDGIITLFPTILLAGLDIIVQLGQGIVQNAPQLLNAAFQSITQFINGLAQAIPQIFTMAVQLIQSFVTSLVSNAPMLIQSAISLIGNFVMGIYQALPLILQAGLQLIVGLIDGILSNIPMLMTLGLQALQTLIQGIVSAIPMLIQAAVQIITSFISFVTNNIGLIIEIGIQMMIAVAVGIVQGIGELVAAIPEVIGALIEAIFTTNWLEVGWEIIKGIGKGLASAASSLWDAGKDLVSNIFGGASEGIDEGAEEVQPSVDGFVSDLQFDTSAVYNNSYQGGMAIPEGMAAGMYSGVGTVDAATADLTNAATLDNLTLKERNMLAIQDSTSGAEHALSASRAGMLFESEQIGAGITAGLGTADQGFGQLAGSATDAATQVQGASDAFGTAFTGMGEASSATTTTIQTDFTTLTTSFTEFSTNIQTTLDTMRTNLQTHLTQAQTMVATATAQIVVTVQLMATNIIMILTTLQAAMFTAGQNAMEGFHQGILSKKDAIMATITAIGQEATAAMQSVLDSNSPSRVFIGLGQDTGQGYQLGLASTIPQVRVAAQDMATAAIQPAQSVVSHRTPDNSPTTNNRSTVVNNNNAQFTLTVNNNGGNNRQAEREVKRWIRDRMKEVINSSTSKQPAIKEV